jgi:transposase
MLDRYLSGNTEALAVLRIPAENEEQSRSQTRQRKSLVSDRGRVSNQGLSNARYYGHDLPEQWWRPRAFKRLEEALPTPLYQLLARLQAVLLVFDEQIAALSKLIEAARPEKLPTGLGALTAEVIDREVGDWKRFKNRRQVASYTGLIPSENSSGVGHKQGSISKHGNPRVRHLLVEAVWRFLQFQPDYKPIKRLLPILRNCKARGQSARRRKLIVALARLFAIDWWRLRTGQVKPEDLGLHMSWPSAAVLRELNPDAQALATP